MNLSYLLLLIFTNFMYPVNRPLQNGPRNPTCVTLQLKDYRTGSELSMTRLALRGTAMSTQYPGDKLHTASTARTPSSHERLNSSSHERLNSCTQTLEGTQVLYIILSL